MEFTIEVENIKCGGCMNSIKNALLKIENIEEVQIDLETQTISVSGTNDFDNTLVTNKLTDLGYPEKGNNSFLSKSKSYVNCAVGKINL